MNNGSNNQTFLFITHIIRPRLAIVGSKYENLDHKKSEIFKQPTFRFLPNVKYENLRGSGHIDNTSF